MIEQIRHPIGDLRDRGILGGNRLAPTAEPRRINFGRIGRKVADARRALAETAIIFQAVASIHQAGDAQTRVAPDLCGRLAGEKQAAEAGLLENFRHRRHVIVVRGTGDAKFIFNLHHQQRPAFARVQIADLFINLRQIFAGPIEPFADRRCGFSRRDISASTTECRHTRSPRSNTARAAEPPTFHSPGRA